MWTNFCITEFFLFTANLEFCEKEKGKNKYQARIAPFLRKANTFRKKDKTSYRVD